ncbi:MAG: DUF3040 domain-containing protein [Micrococcales bacterium]|nr:DUF3040 domain-containing protein [Micrococcales bacterium]
MPLSEYEQRVLEQMERHLSTDDPRLANRLTQRRHRSVTRYIIAAIGLVVGLLALVLGVDLSLPWLGAVGFVVMFATVAYAFARPRERGAADPGADAFGPPKAAGPAKGSKRGMMDRFEDRWNRRRDQG